MNILANIYKDCTATLVLHKKSRKLPMKKRVRQGCTICLMLFTACLEEVLNLLDWEGFEVIANGEYLSNLPLADAIVLISNNGANFNKWLRTLTEKV